MSSLKRHNCRLKRRNFPLILHHYIFIDHVCLYRWHYPIPEGCPSTVEQFPSTPDFDHPASRMTAKHSHAEALAAPDRTVVAACGIQAALDGVPEQERNIPVPDSNLSRAHRAGCSEVQIDEAMVRYMERTAAEANLEELEKQSCGRSQG